MSRMAAQLFDKLAELKAGDTPSAKRAAWSSLAAKLRERGFARVHVPAEGESLDL